MRRITPALLIAVLFGACAPKPAPMPTPTLYPASQLEPVASEWIAVWGSEPNATSGDAVRIASQHLPAKLKRTRSERLMWFRSDAGARGANVIFVQPFTDGSEDWVAYYVASEAARVRAARNNSTARSSGSSTSESSAKGCVGSCEVRVKGYRHKHGTYVKPHTRNRPGSKSRDQRP